MLHNRDLYMLNNVGISFTLSSATLPFLPLPAKMFCPFPLRYMSYKQAAVCSLARLFSISHAVIRPVVVNGVLQSSVFQIDTIAHSPVFPAHRCHSTCSLAQCCGCNMPP